MQQIQTQVKPEKLDCPAVDWEQIDCHAVDWDASAFLRNH